MTALEPRFCMVCNGTFHVDDVILRCEAGGGYVKKCCSPACLERWRSRKSWMWVFDNQRTKTCVE